MTGGLEEPSGAESPPGGHLVDVTLDEATIGQASPEVAMERRTAIHDLLLDNAFAPVGPVPEAGRYRLALGQDEGRLVFAITQDGGASQTVTHTLSLTPLRRVIRDYWAIFESYTQAASTLSPAQLEAIDMGRRGIHDEGAQILAERLEGKVRVDHATARRLFTLICTLQWRGSYR